MKSINFEDKGDFRSAVFDRMAEAVYLTDIHTKRVVKWNFAFQKMLGYTNKELRNMNIYNFVAHDMDNIDDYIQCVLRKEEHFHGERKWRRKVGLLLDVEVTAKLIYQKERKVICIVGRDITERKRSEMALRKSEETLRLLSSHLLKVAEIERRRLAFELHDELGQSLLVLKLRLAHIKTEWFREMKLPADEYNDALHYIDQITDSIRRIARGLRPSILEDLGLSAALRWLCDKLQQNHNIRTSISIEEIDVLFSQDNQILIFRIFQEALTNIVKHSCATKVLVKIKKNFDSISFSITDNGKGFKVRQDISNNLNETTLGLVAMDERIKILGGTLNISSAQMQGTKIFFSLPIDLH